MNYQKLNKLKLALATMIVLSIFVCSITFEVFYQSWSQSTELLLTSVYDEILTNNERLLRYKLERAAKKFYIAQVTVNNSIKLEEESNIFASLRFKISMPIFSNDDEKRGLLGYFVCYYSITHLLIALLLEIAGMILTSFYAYHSLKRYFHETLKAELLAKKKLELADLAAKMAHDIRSPLSLLNAIIKQSNADFENIRNLLQIAVDRINSIAEDLLNKKNQSSKVNYIEDTSVLIQEIMNEKRIEVKTKKDVQLKVSADGCNGIPLFGNPNEIKRIISNVFNNAVESVSSDGRIKVYTRTLEKYVSISIQDNGCGIKPEVLRQLGDSELTTKENGNGLGLFFAKKYLNSIGGNINISSNVDKGTIVEIILQR